MYEFHAKQVTKFAATRLNALSPLHIVTSDNFTISEADPVSPVNIDYLTAEYGGFPLFDSE